MTRCEKIKFRPGETVFARWHGSQELEIVEKITCNSSIPHYKCKIWGGRRYEYWILPQIHLSRASIETLIKEANRKQLSLT